jgi:hypothetical protein
MVYISPFLDISVVQIQGTGVNQYDRKEGCSNDRTSQRRTD